jgi:Na+(H+)/acetate symporter ActP
MGSVLAAAAPISSNTREVLLVVFLSFLVVTLLFCLLVGPEEDQADAFYKGGRSGLFGSVLALAGVCLPAATVLGTTGTISLFG